MVSGISDWGSDADEREQRDVDAVVAWSDALSDDSDSSHGGVGRWQAVAGAGAPDLDCDGDSVSSWHSGSVGGRTFRQLIIGTCADSDVETRQRALDCGMDAFLPKVSLYVVNILYCFAPESHVLAPPGEGKIIWGPILS